MEMKFSSDKQAIQTLERAGFTFDRGLISPPPRDKRLFNEQRYDPTKTEADAIDYLCQPMFACPLGYQHLFYTACLGTQGL